MNEPYQKMNPVLNRTRRLPCLMVATLLGLFHVSMAADNDSETPLNARGQSLLATYTEMLASLRAEITAAAPAIDEGKKAAFEAAHAAVKNVPAVPNPKGLKLAPAQFPEVISRENSSRRFRPSPHAPSCCDPSSRGARSP